MKRARRRGAERIGLREQRKLATRERIRVAAADLFTRHGYGAATMREIAQRAHVGLGTLFNYAEDKRDLVFLIFNEELNAITDVALAAPRPGQSLVDQLIAVFRVHYRWLAGKPALARILLQELTFYSSGKQAATFLGIRKRLIDGLEALVRAAQRARRIRSRSRRCRFGPPRLQHTRRTTTSPRRRTALDKRARPRPRPFSLAVGGAGDECDLHFVAPCSAPTSSASSSGRHTDGTRRRFPSLVLWMPGSSSALRSQSWQVTCWCFWSSASQ